MVPNVLKGTPALYHAVTCRERSKEQPGQGTISGKQTAPATATNYEFSELNLLRLMCSKLRFANHTHRQGKGHF